MKRNSSVIYSFVLVIGDFLALVAAFAASYIFRVKIDSRPVVNPIAGRDFIEIFALLTPIIIVIFATLQLYSRQVYERRVSEFSRLLVGSFVGILVLISYDFLSDRTIFFARLIALYAFSLGFILLVTERSIVRWTRRWFFGYGAGITRVLIIGDNEISKNIIDHIGNTKETGKKVVGIIGQEKSWIKKMRLPCSMETKLITRLKPDMILQTGLFDNKELSQQIISLAQQQHISYKFVPEQASFFAGNTEVELYQSIPVISVDPTALIGWGMVVKRIFDVFASGIILLVLSPLMLVIAVLIKITDPSGPILFKQRRLTRFDNKFDVLKFRTMIQKYSGSGSNEVEIFKSMGREDLAREFIENRGKVTNDPRITKVGKVLRATSLDELPQLFNVLRGDISLVGPRAIVELHAEEYKENRPLMLSVKTGITGLAQVSGRDNLGLDERIRLDVYYVQNWSFWLDMSILLKTAYMVITRKGFKS